MAGSIMLKVTECTAGQPSEMQELSLAMEAETFLEPDMAGMCPYLCLSAKNASRSPLCYI